MLEEKTIRDNNFTKDIYSAIFKQYYPSLLFYANRFLDMEQAEDIVQDAFVELWERRDSIEMGDRISAFMYRSVYSKMINRLKHEAVTYKYNAVQADIYKIKMDYFSPDNNEVIKKIENKEIKKEIFIAINDLPDRCKEVFKLSYLSDLKNKDIAETLDISLRTVEAHMYKALKHLRGKLKHLVSFML